MNKEEGLSTRLWLEEYKNQNGDKKSLCSQPFELDSQRKSQIKQFLKTQDLAWEPFITACFGMLLNRFAASDFFLFGVTKIINKRKDEIKIESPVKIIRSNFNPKLTINTFFKNIQKQFELKKFTTANLSEIRYLLLFKNGDQSNSSELINTFQFPLNLIVDKKNPDTFNFLYHPDFFSDTNITYLLQHFDLLLNEICNSNSRKKLIKLNILLDDEKKKIFEEWRQPRYDFLIPEMSLCFPDLFFEQSQKYPRYNAVSYKDQLITYKELDETSTYLAQHLLKKGINKGDAVAVLMERSPTLIMTMLAVFKCGAVFVPIDARYTNKRIEYILDDCRAKVILLDEMTPFSQTPFNKEKIMVIDEKWEKLKNNNVHPFPSLNKSDIACILYTSGHIGQTKGTMIKHQGLSNLIAWYQACFAITPHDRASQFSSHGIDDYFCETIPFLASGASVHIINDHIKLIPSLFFSWLKNEKISICSLPTSYAQSLLSLSWPKNLDLRILKISGERMNHYPDKVFSFDIWNIYGSAETTFESTFIKLCSANTTYYSSKRNLSPPIGRPISNTDVYVVDKYFQPVPVGVAGELFIGGKGVSAGYLNHPELTEKKFITNPFYKNSTEKLYRTGDLVRWLPDGNLQFIDRIENQIKMKGYRIELGDIENIIGKHADVNNVVVIVQENQDKHKSIIAYVTPDLNKYRFLYQEKCLLFLDKDKYIETISENISKNGISLYGINDALPIGNKIQFRIKLPGQSVSKPLMGYIIWQEKERCGIAFDMNEADKKMVENSIEYYFSTHDMTDLLLSASIKRNLLRAIQKKIPDYMMPSQFVTLLQFPMNLNGKIDNQSLPKPANLDQIIEDEYIMPRSETEIELTQICSELFMKEKISMSDNLFDIGGESIKIAELGAIIQQHFHVDVPLQLIFELPYIPVLAEYINIKIKEVDKTRS